MKVEKLGTNRVKFSFNVTKDEFAHALDYAFNQVKENVEVKGFRKGHVTRKVYETKFGVESLYEEALNHVFSHKYPEVFQNKEHEIIGEPTPIVNFNEVNVDGNFEVALEFAVKPEVKLGEYIGIKVDKLEALVTDEEVNSQIDQLLNQNQTLEVKEGSLEDGDTAIFDYKGFSEGVQFDGGTQDNASLEIGSGQFIPGFEEQMIGMNPGEARDINVKFPEQYHSEDLAGKDAIFKVVLHEVKTAKKQELNDEWVLSLERDAKTVSELKEEISKNIKKGKENQNKNIQLEQALSILAENSTVDIPEEMIEFELKNQLKNIEDQAKQYGLDFNTYLSLTGMNEEDLKAQVRKESEARVLNSLLIEAVSKKEDFKVTKEEIEEKYVEIANMYQMDVLEVKKHLTDDVLEKDIVFAKAIDFIFDNLTFN